MASGTDQLVLDVEDAVDPKLKPQALADVIAWLEAGNKAWVRINDFTTSFWAADVAADIFVAAGFPNVSVNAAGDVANRGFQSPNQPWVVGIRHPEHELEVVRTVESLNGAVATSGEYERGPHIRNPHTGASDVKLTSATVVGPDGGMADALATALVIAGTDGVKWFAGMDEWSAYLIVDGNAHFFGPAFESRVEVATS